MKKGIELEYKMLLTYRQFQRIQQKYEFDFPFKQINHYYDTPEKALNSRRFALRIRDVDGQKILTLKTPQKIGVMEYECPVDSYDFSQIMLPKEIAEQLSFINCNELECFGSLTTYRSIYETENATICLDDNTYVNIHDYEIEYEVKREHDSLESFMELLRSNGIYEFIPAPGKAKRIKKAIHF